MWVLKCAHLNSSGLTAIQTVRVFCLSQAEQVISTLRKDDEAKRRELSKIFQDSLKTLEALDDYVLNHLISEGTINDLQDDMTKYINNLETNECPILVAGTLSLFTSFSPKSSFCLENAPFPPPPT